MAVALRREGVIVVEVPYVRDLLDRVEFDTIYHEHLCYFSLSALDRLFERHGLRIAGVERIPVHGGSLRLFAERADSPGEGPWRARPLVDALLAEEAAWGIGGLAPYRSFGDRVGRLRDELVALVDRLRSEGRRIAVYGASAKSCILLNYCGIGRETLEFVVDRSPVKQGRFTPGTHLPIHPPEELLERSRTTCCSDLELGRRDPRAAGRIPAPGRPIHRADSRREHRLAHCDSPRRSWRERSSSSRSRVSDERGFFARTWCRREWQRRGLNAELAQCSMSFNHAGRDAARDALPGRARTRRPSWSAARGVGSTT